MNAKDRRELVAAVGALNSADLIGLSQGLLTLACELPSKGEMQFFAQELMGAVNAVATIAATAVGVLWWALAYRDTDRRRWVRFGAWWALGGALVCAWWIVPLVLLSRVSPPFLDFIESSRVTTQWSSLTEVLRGTSSWTPFVSPERVAGAILVTQPAAVLATGVLAAAGLAGLTMAAMPYRRTLVAILGAGGIGFDVAEYLTQSGPSGALDPTAFNAEWGIDTTYAHRGGVVAAQPEPPARKVFRQVFGGNGAGGTMQA